MNIVHVADIHISESRITEFKVLIKQLADKIKSHNPDLIVFSGDMFTHRDTLTPSQVELARDFFKEHLKGFNILVTVGNHDISMNETKADSLSAIFSNDSVKVYTEVGSFVDIDDYRFHMFPYPSKSEMVRLGLTDFSSLANLDYVSGLFQIDKNKKNILIFHGSLEGFVHASGSAVEIGIGKDLLHKHQVYDKAVYCGCPFPLTFSDDLPTGFVLWRGLNPQFIEIEQLYPYITVNLGHLALTGKAINEEISRRLYNNEDYTDCRIKVKYKISIANSGEIDNRVIAGCFRNAKEIKIASPKRIEKGIKNFKFPPDLIIEKL